MGITNELYVISNTARGEIGFLFLGFAIIIVFYSIFSVEYKRRRLEKLEEAAELINKGHQKVVKARRNGEIS